MKERQDSHRGRRRKLTVACGNHMNRVRREGSSGRGELEAGRGGEVCWQPTRKAWNVKRSGWKRRIMHGRSAVESRGVGGHGDERER